MNAIRRVLNPKVRTFIYAQATLIGGLLMFYGVVSDEDVAFWIGFVDATLGNLIALFHTPNTNSAVSEERPL